ncbi:MAG TPA: 16S rRNA (cytosine(1402)-N(4))-methyltransferase RsmH [Methylibium sp.]|uniref:16S rRNA (cytosine(1402)-N(4))-methyltransferase RsmH n=1 Tax=Methylibium sp. TaxID=2067992 RepID=UPI002DBAAD7A|nr:16S rRNA (cytosine(1402)-N(4))-methyltransferase RsmH [Methylibium sp.]HEU4460584.1 16S rRNA (cytosine(1402)-N(4))-methyltransferase RsmH [Methylibium sp.]
MQADPQPLQHTTVLLHEATEALVTRADGVYVDGTYGRGGHARAVLVRLSPAGRLIAIDRDPQALADATEGARRIDDARFTIEHAAFAELPGVLAAHGVRRVDGLLLDLGISSPQIDDPRRGFSFRADGPLDMRMDPTRGESAADFIARADEGELVTVIRDYGEERFARTIARRLVERREAGTPVRSTADLAALVARCVPTREGGQDPATRTFQALRIAVNAELAQIEQALDAALACLAPGGRLVVISFHSLEDRIVKSFIARHSKELVDRRSPAYWGRRSSDAQTSLSLRAIARVKPGEAEIAANPRARSAVMRVAERTSGGERAAGAPAPIADALADHRRRPG